MRWWEVGNLIMQVSNQISIEGMMNTYNPTIVSGREGGQLRVQ